MDLEKTEEEIETPLVDVDRLSVVVSPPLKCQNAC